LPRIASKHQHYGRTSRRASCNRIVNPRARPHLLENPSLARWPAFLRPGCGHRGSGAGTLSLPGGGRHLHRSRGADDNPLLPRLDDRRHPASQAGDEIRHKVPYLVRPYDFADSDILAITELRGGVLTNLPGEDACLRLPLLEDFERRARPRSLSRRLHPGCLPSVVTHCWVSCYPQVVTNLWMDEVPASAGTSQEKTRFSPWINESSP